MRFKISYSIVILCLVFMVRQSMAKDKEYYRSIGPVNFDLANAEENDVIYKLFTNANTSDRNVEKILLTKENVKREKFERNIPTVLIMHGWTTDDTSPWFLPLKEAYFNLGTFNVIFINWSVAGNKSYFESSANVKPVGKFIADFLIASEIPPEKIHLVGHSLGSHLTSYIGKSMFQLSGKKIGRITALDPAGPSFEREEMKKDERLNEDDAVFVDVIHSDIGYSGYTKPIGHVDYYPNGGGFQPGCPNRDVDDNCSHARSTRYFIESVNKKVECIEATFEEIDKEVQITVKKGGDRIVFGQHVDQRTRGIFFFETNHTVPYLLQ